MNSYTICILPGDGIGPEVVHGCPACAGCSAIKFCTGLKPRLVTQPTKHLGTPLPDITLQQILTADATLFGAVTTPPDIKKLPFPGTADASGSGPLRQSAALPFHPAPGIKRWDQSADRA